MGGKGQELCDAAWRECLEEKKRLIRKGVDIESRDSSGHTELHRAAAGGSVEVVTLLLDRGANVEAVCKHGRASLHLAAQNGDGDVVKMLLDRGANIEATSKHGCTSLHLAAVNGHGDVVKMLLDRGANVEAANENGLTSLHLAAVNGRGDMVKMLLDRGANVEAGGSHGWPSLHLAAAKGHGDVVKMLLDRGANIEAANENGLTSLHQAAWSGRGDVVKLLIDRGAVVDAPTANGETPLLLANRFGREKVIKLLLRLGADSRWMTRKMTKAEMEDFRSGKLDVVLAYTGALTGKYDLSAEFVVQTVANRRFKSLKQIIIAHNLVLLVHRSGVDMRNGLGPDFWYVNLYKRLRKFRLSDSKALVAGILYDAVEKGILTRNHLPLIDVVGDTTANWTEQFQQLGPIVRDAYDRLFRIEGTMQNVQNKVDWFEVKAIRRVARELKTLKKMIKKAQRKPLVLNVARLGLSFIPVAGSCLRTAGEIDDKAPTWARDVGDLVLAMYDVGDGSNYVLRSRPGIDIGNPKVVQSMFSEDVIKQLPARMQKLLTRSVEELFGGFEALRSELDKIVVMTTIFIVGESSAAKADDKGCSEVDKVGATVAKVDATPRLQVSEREADTAESTPELEEEEKDDAVVTTNQAAEDAFADEVAREMVGFICKGYSRDATERLRKAIYKNASDKHVTKQVLSFSDLVSAQDVACMLLDSVVSKESLELGLDGRAIAMKEYVRRLRKNQTESSLL